MWSQDNIRNIIANPIYTGFANYPKIIDDDVWIEAGLIAIEQEGMENYLERVFENLKEVFGREYPRRKEFIEISKKIKSGKEFLKLLLKDLRNFYKKWRITSGISAEIIHFINFLRHNLYSRIYNSSISDFVNPPILRNSIIARFAKSSKCVLSNPPILSSK